MLNREYVCGSYVDEPLALINGGGTYFYADNRVYSPAAMTDVWGAVVERYRYDSYGNRTVMLADDSAPKTSGFVGNQRGFTGYYADAESGLYYARARMYSPVLGRFIGRDPLSYDQLISDLAQLKNGGGPATRSGANGANYIDPAAMEPCLNGGTSKALTKMTNPNPTPGYPVTQWNSSIYYCYHCEKDDKVCPKGQECLLVPTTEETDKGQTRTYGWACQCGGDIQPFMIPSITVCPVGGTPASPPAQNPLMLQ